MCGISGIYSLNGNVQPERVKRMTNTLRHRGPNDEGYLLVNTRDKDWIACGGEDTVKALQMPVWERYQDRTFNLALGHRRLSILDLSPAGHGPMSYMDEQLWITYNGEIYNYLELREELNEKGYSFKTRTDTEVILAAYAEWGTDCLNHFNGMWAFGLVDLRKQRFFCSRDRAGVKPFYYFYDGKRFCFASEIKALLCIEGFSPVPNEQIIADYLFSGLIDHTSETFFKEIYQLRPAEYLVIEGGRFTRQIYWDIEDRGPSVRSNQNHAEMFLGLLQDSVRIRLRSDVPVGTCLSGGLDSSAIVCLANRLMFDSQNIDRGLVGERQKTFSSCFEEPAYDERKFIEAALQQTGAEKNYVFPGAEGLKEELVQLIRHQDEPFSSTSIYAQWDVMRAARRRGVTVLLDGQGGDELLAGYLPSFSFLFQGILKQMDLISLLRESLGLWEHHRDRLDDAMRKTIASLVPTGLKPLFQNITRDGVKWSDAGFLKKYLRSHSRPRKFKEPLNDYLYQLFRSTLLPGLLRYEDRNSMAFSLETRLPFLDYRLIEFSFGLPVDQKIRAGVTKVILRNAMKGVLPEEIRGRMDKMGFMTPEAVWFRSTLRKQIEEIINSRSFAERGYFNVREVHQTFLDHCGAKVNRSALIWRWVNLELWFRAFVDGGSSEIN